MVEADDDWKVCEVEEKEVVDDVEEEGSLDLCHS